MVPEGLRVATLSYAFEAHLRSPEELLERYQTLPGWARALRVAGAAEVDVWQRFHRDADLPRDGFTLHLRRAGPGAQPRPWTPLGDLHSELLARAPDVVHVNGLVHPWPLPHLRARLPRGCALVLQDHAASGPPSGLARRLVWRRALSSAHAFLFTAVEQALPWRAAGLISPDQPVYAVPEASRDVLPASARAGRQALPRRGAPALLWVGRLHPVKDPLTLLSGLELALEALPGASLTMVFGSEELLPAVRARLAGAPALRQRVQLAGRVAAEQLPDYYEAADAFVAASRREGSGYALLEALSFGLVPVLSDIPSFRALTDDGRLARLFAAGDAQSCATALRGLASADFPGESAALRAHFAQQLSWDAVGRRALEAYRAALALVRQRSSR